MKSAPPPIRGACLEDTPCPLGGKPVPQSGRLGKGVELKGAEQNDFLNVKFAMY
jgi:hypothetical protein